MESVTDAWSRPQVVTRVPQFPIHNNHTSEYYGKVNERHSGELQVAAAQTEEAFKAGVPNCFVLIGRPGRGLPLQSGPSADLEEIR